MTVPPPQPQTSEGDVHTVLAENPCNQETLPALPIAVAEPVPVVEPLVTLPAFEPLVPLPAQVVQDLIALHSDQAKSIAEHNARGVDNRGNATLVRANTSPRSC